MDFGKMGLVPDPISGHKKVCWALIFTAGYSRHCFIWLSFPQTTRAVIAGFKAAWAFFGGVFKVVIPENVPRHIFGADARGRPVRVVKSSDVAVQEDVLVLV